MGSVNDVLNWCRSQIGHVGGADYWQIVYGYRSDDDWCAVWNSAAYKVTNTECAYWPSTVAFDEYDKPVIGDAWRGPYDLQPGDSIAYSYRPSRKGDHVGIVEAVEGYGAYTTIEGNCSNEVKRKYRTVWNDGIVGGIRPRFDGGGGDDLYTFATVQRGSHGDTVGMMQATLNVRMGAYILALDRDFGPYTEQILKDYQRANGLVPDGVCGPITWKKLLCK